MKNNMSIDLKKIKYKDLGFFRFRKLDKQFILTNDAGEYQMLSEKDFKDFIEGKLNKDSEPFLSLAKKNFVKKEIDLDSMVARYRTKKGFVYEGPSLHIIVVTLRCNQKCIYCHASAQDVTRKDLDMDLATAKKTLDLIFQSSSKFIDIEFQGGEPLLNWPVVKFIIEEAQKINKRKKKDLEIKLVSNFSLMDDEKYKFLLDNKVGLCTSLDGPKELHDRNRPAKNVGNFHDNIAKWVKRFNKDYPKLKKKRYIWRMAALTTISGYSLNKYKEIVDEYVNLGFSGIFLRPLDPFGFSKNIWHEIGYSADDFIEFYKKSLDYVIKLNQQGIFFEEKFAKMFLVKILTDHDPNMMENRSPCGAGIGQLAYNYNGNIYTCDEGRMMSMMGDDSFMLGNVDDTYRQIVSSPVTRTVCSASCLDGLAGCSDCAYNPYCGVCPIYNYIEQGNIFGQMPNNDKCKINMAILDYLFEKMKDQKVKKVFEKWLKNSSDL